VFCYDKRKQSKNRKEMRAKNVEEEGAEELLEGAGFENL